MKPVFFATPAAWRRWLAANHKSKPEILVGFHKRVTGRPCITWPESVDEALCYGWIDGIRKSGDDDTYTIRFTPRRPNSLWSAVNLRKVAQLTKQKRMRAAGLKVYDERNTKRALHGYDYSRTGTYTPAQLRALKANPAAWEFLQAQAPSYQRLAAWWVTSAKQEATRTRRLAKLALACAAKKRLY